MTTFSPVSQLAEFCSLPHTLYLDVKYLPTKCRNNQIFHIQDGIFMSDYFLRDTPLFL